METTKAGRKKDIPRKLDTISGKDERHADRKAPAILSHKDGSAEWADRATAQEGAARTDAAGRGNGAGWTFWVITEQ